MRRALNWSLRRANSLRLDAIAFTTPSSSYLAHFILFNSLHLVGAAAYFRSILVRLFEPRAPCFRRHGHGFRFLHMGERAGEGQFSPQA